MPRGGGLPRWRWATAGRAPPPCRALRRRGYAPLGVGFCTSGGSAPPPLCGPTPLEAWVYRRPLGGRGLHLRGGAPPSPLWVYTFGGMGLPGVPLGGRRRRLQGWPPSRRASAPLGVAAGGSCLGVGLCAAGGGALLHHSAGYDPALRSVVHYCAAVCRNIMQYGAALRNVTQYCVVGASGAE